MSESLEKMAAKIRAQFKECGSVVFWGRLMIQPHEAIYDVKRVDVTEDSLTIHLAAKDDGTPIEIRIVRPMGLKIDRINSLKVDSVDELWFDGRLAKGNSHVPALVLD